MFPEYVTAKSTFNNTHSDKKMNIEEEKGMKQEKTINFVNNDNIALPNDYKAQKENESQGKKFLLSANYQQEKKLSGSNYSDNEPSNQKDEIELEIKDQKEFKFAVKDIEERGILEDIQPIRTGCFSPDGQFSYRNEF